MKVEAAALLLLSIGYVGLLAGSHDHIFFAVSIAGLVLTVVAVCRFYVNLGRQR